MGDIERVNITLPKKLIARAKILIDEGLFSNFSELIRESLKNELRLDAELIDKKSILDKWFKEEEGSGFDTSGLTQEELFKRIRKTRDELWDQKYKDWFTGLKR